MIVSREQYKLRVQELLLLFKRSFGRELSEAYLQWRFIDNSSGNLLASFEIVDEKVVANHSASPCILKHNDVESPAALTLMLMTDPEFSGKGLFTKLGKELIAYMDKLNLLLTFGFPNANSRPGLINRLGWGDVSEIPTMVMKLPQKSNDYEQFPEIIRDDKFDLDYSQTQNFKGLIHVKKDKKYLKWRYAQNPTNDYSNFVIENNGIVSSYCVVKKYLDEEIDIVDLQPTNADEADRLLKHIVAYASRLKMRQINAWIPLSFFTHEIYEKMGFVAGEKTTSFCCRVIDKTSSVAEMVKDFSNWYIQMGDSDVY